MDPEYTEFGFKIHKLRLTLKVQKRTPSADNAVAFVDNTADDNAPTRQQRPRTRSSRTAARRRPSSVASAEGNNSIGGLISFDSNVAGSRRPISSYSGSTRLANWEFQGFYNRRSSTPSSSGYSSTDISRTNSFSSDIISPATRSRPSRLSSAEDSVYSEVYTTIEEDENDGDPFDEIEKSEITKSAETLKAPSNPQPPPPLPKKGISHIKTKSMSSLLDSFYNSRNNTIKNSSNSSSSNCNNKHKKTKSLLEDSNNHNSSNNRSRNNSDNNIHSSSNVSRFRSSSSSSNLPPPLPPRSSKSRPPARPPYPSSLVRAVLDIAQPINR